MKPLVLIVDDEPGILTQLSHILEDEGFRTLVTGKGEEALELYRRRRPAVVFLDIWLPYWDGLETLRAIRDLGSQSRGGHDLGSRDRAHGRQGDQDGGVRLPR